MTLSSKDKTLCKYMILFFNNIVNSRNFRISSDESMYTICRAINPSDWDYWGSYGGPVMVSSYTTNKNLFSIVIDNHPEHYYEQYPVTFDFHSELRHIDIDVDRLDSKAEFKSVLREFINLLEENNYLEDAELLEACL